MTDAGRGSFGKHESQQPCRMAVAPSFSSTASVLMWSSSAMNQQPQNASSCAGPELRRTIHADDVGVRAARAPAFRATRVCKRRRFERDDLVQIVVFREARDRVLEARRPWRQGVTVRRARASSASDLRT